MFNLISTLEDLEFLNNELNSKSVVAVDTEFRRTTKDNMRLALLQVNDDEEIYLIDAIAIDNPEDCASFLFSDSVLKVLHSCKEDLEAIFSWTNSEMRNIFDTQIANALLNDEYSISYQNLVEERLEIALEKKETRSNWIRRPLSDAQLKYASLDVEYLLYLYRELNNELIQTSKLDWLKQDIERLIKNTFRPNNSLYALERTVTKAEEIELLEKFDKIVREISEREKINSTLLFSKKSQKEFLRLVFISGLDQACEELTAWREALLKKPILEMLR